MNIIQAWITLNRECNLRCNWCYAKGRGFNTNDCMNENTVLDLITFLSDLGVKNVYFTGGEPTCDELLEKYILYAHHHGLSPALITNGLALQNTHFLRRLKDVGLVEINLSMKGWSEDSYILNTGKNAYSQVLQAIQNVARLGINHVVSFVLSSNNVDSYLLAVSKAVECGAARIYLSFEQDFSALDSNCRKNRAKELKELVGKFESSYEELCIITQGHFILHQSLPFCIWTPSILKDLKDRKQLSSNCHLRERSGLVFDTDGSLLMCNSMYQVPIGRYGVNFQNATSFRSFWNSDKTRNAYCSLSKLPSEACSSCEDKTFCGGGCIANWLHFDLDELKKA